MNTDYLIENAKIRNKRISNKFSCRKCRYRNCEHIDKYAKEQNTVYDPIKNLMLYGINSNMAVSGVSDGTCNQINPLIFTQNQICGAGSAGGNPCKNKNVNGIENFTSSGCNFNNPLQNILLLIIIIIFIVVLFNKKT